MLTPRKTLSLTPAALLAALAGTALGQSTIPFPAQLQLSTLLPLYGGVGSNGFVINACIGCNNYGIGQSVSSAGDVNGDGFDDLIIGAPFACTDYCYSGVSYVVFGGVGIGAGGVPVRLSKYSTTGFVLNGIDMDDYSGASVSSAGDVNGDGIDDMIIGARYADPNGNILAGESYVVFGGVGVGVGVGRVINLSSLNGTNGFVLNGIDAGDISGHSVSSAGDVNGDGIDDLIIGADGADPNGNSSAGESYVVFGAVGIGFGGVIELSSLNGTNGFVLNGIDADDRSGRSVSSAGDVNGDGIDDFIIGAPNGNGSTGESYVVFGAVGVGSAGVVDLSTLNGTNGFVLNGIDGSANSGQSVSCAGDVNGDGINDLIIGTLGPGERYVVFGAVGVGSGGVIELSSLDGANGFVLNVSLGNRFRNIASAGDVNGDGIDDLIIGAPNATISYSNSGGGESYVVFGRDTVMSGNFPAQFELLTLLPANGGDGSNGFGINGINMDDDSGFSVSSAGDVNGDGIDDLLIGAFGAAQSYVVFGRAVGFVACPGDANGDSVVNFGDITSVLGNWLFVCP